MADAKASKADAIRRLREEQWDRRQAAKAPEPKAKPAAKKKAKKKRRAKGLRLP